MNLDSELTIRSPDVRTVNVPMQRPLKTGGGEVKSGGMCLVDLLTDEEVSGCSYLFCPTPLALESVAKLLSNLAPLVEGERLAPREIERKLHKTSRLVGAQGLTGMARAGIDMATWDEEAVRRYLVG